MLIQTTEMFFFGVRIGLWIQPESRTRVRAIAHMSRSWETTGATLVKASLAVTLVRCRSSCVNTCSPFGWQGTQLVHICSGTPLMIRLSLADVCFTDGPIYVLRWSTWILMLNILDFTWWRFFGKSGPYWLNKEVVAFVIYLTQLLSKLR